MPSRPAAAASTPYHHGALPAAMLAAAQGILESEGIEALTLRAAARAAGVSHAAPKNHFGDLTGLLSELAAIGFGQFTHELNEAMAQADSDDPEARLEAMGRAYVGFAKANPGMFLLMFRSERLDAERPALREALRGARAALAGSMAARMGLAPTADGTPTPQQGAAMVRAWSMVHGFAMLLIDGRLDGIIERIAPGGDWRTLLDSSFQAPGPVVAAKD
jgi:AcrR family transcriptional regulator